MTLIYLAGPVDALPFEESRDWRVRAAELLGKEGFATFSPPHAFTVPTQEALPRDGAENLILINEFALEHSAGVIAKLEGQSFGTPLEVQRAYDLDIPCWAFGGSPWSVFRHRYQSGGTLEGSIEGLVEELRRRYQETQELARQAESAAASGGPAKLMD